MIFVCSFLCGFLCYLLGFANGLVSGGRSAAKDCERLGGFYADGKIYKCSEVLGTIPAPKQD